MARKVLVADDSVTIQKVVQLTFANEDIELSFVDNGEEAISIARKLKPDLIMADVLMPGRSGYEVCEFIKTDPELRDTPVLLLTGTFEPFDADRCAQVRADGTITKPFESQTLVRQVHELLDRPLVRSAGAPGAAPDGEWREALSSAPARPAGSAGVTRGEAGPAAAADPGGEGDDDLDLGGDAIEAPEDASHDEAALDEAFEFTRDPDTALGRRGMEAPQTPDEGALEGWTSPGAREPEALPADTLPQDEDVWDLSDFEAVEEGSSPDEGQPGAGDEPEELWNEAAAEAIDIVESTNFEIESEAPLTEAGPASGASSEPLEEIHEGPSTAPRDAIVVDADDRFGEIDGESEFDEFALSPSADAAEPELEPLDIDRPGPAPGIGEARDIRGFAPAEDGLLERESPNGAILLEELTLEEISDDEAFAHAARPGLEPGEAAPPEAQGSGAAVPGLPSENSAAIVRNAVKDAVEKVTWEAFSDLSETVVRAVQDKVEKIAWEVIPQMAETIIKEEIRKLKEGEK